MIRSVGIEKMADGILRDRPYMTRAEAVRYAEKLIQTIDERLEVNISEWLERRPLSSIEYTCGNGLVFSVAIILEHFPTHDFWSALEGMNDFFVIGDDARYTIRRDDL